MSLCLPHVLRVGRLYEQVCVSRTRHPSKDGGGLGGAMAVGTRAGEERLSLLGVFAQTAWRRKRSRAGDQREDPGVWWRKARAGEQSEGSLENRGLFDSLRGNRRWRRWGCGGLGCWQDGRRRGRWKAAGEEVFAGSRDVIICAQLSGQKDCCLFKYFCFTELQFSRHNKICFFSLVFPFSICSRCSRLPSAVEEVTRCCRAGFAWAAGRGKSWGRGAHSLCPGASAGGAAAGGEVEIYQV